MSDDFIVIDKAIGSVIEIEEYVSVWRMPTIFGRNFKTIADYIEKNDAEVVDMPYGFYKDMDWEVEVNRSKLSLLLSLFTKKWHFFVGMVSSKELPGSGDLKGEKKDNQKFVQAIHLGPYQSSSETYKKLFDWSKANKISLKNESYEFYANDPNEVDKKDIKTIIYIPVKDL